MWKEKDFLTIRVYKKDKERWKKLVNHYKANGKTASDLFSDMLDLIEREIKIFRRFGIV